MEEHSDDNASADMASRIEKTLADREQARMKELPVTIEGSDPGSSRGRTTCFNYLMLLLGVAAGAVIGAALYSILFVPASPPAPGLQSAEVSGELEEADRLFSAGQYEPAGKIYLALISQGADSPRPYNNLASLYAAEGDLEQAQTLLKQALETDPDYLAVYNNVGMVYAAMARDSYGRALQLESETRQVRLQPLGLIAKLPLVAQEVQPQEVTKIQVAQRSVTAEKPEMPEMPGSAPPVVAEVQAVSVPAVPEPKVQTETAEVGNESALEDELARNEEVVVAAVTVSAAQDLAISDPTGVVSPSQFLKQWAMAWSSQDVESYLQAYAAEFVPGDLTRKDWQEKRRQRLSAPSFIEVGLDSIELLSETESASTVQAIQVYRSDRYHDRTRKRFVLRRNGQTWVILEERSLGRVR